MEYLLLVLQSASAVFGIRPAYEQAKYDVVGRLPGGAEVRQYAPRLAADTTVSAGDEARSRDEAFRLLPAKLTADTAPLPRDARVKVVTVPAETETMAVARFNGSWDPRNIEEKKRLLLESFKSSGRRGSPTRSTATRPSRSHRSAATRS